MFEIPSIEGEKQVIVNRDVIENSSKPEIVYKKKTA
jgi:ATP-dependent protease Clp ATPase subunit